VDYKGIEFRLKMIQPNVWKYRFQIGRGIKSGRTKTALELLAIRNVHKRIDRELTLALLGENALGAIAPRTKPTRNRFTPTAT
jgi:hypothetical protein